MPFSSCRCDGVTRREFLRVGTLSALGLTLSDALRLRAASAAGQRLPPAAPGLELRVGDMLAPAQLEALGYAEEEVVDVARPVARPPVGEALVGEQRRLPLSRHPACA